MMSRLHALGPSQDLLRILARCIDLHKLVYLMTDGYCGSSRAIGDFMMNEHSKKKKSLKKLNK